MDWRAKNTSVNVHHEPRGSKELGEDFVDVRALPDVPQRLGMVHRDNAIRLGSTAIPRRAVCKVGAHEGRDLTCCVANEAWRDYISDHYIAIGLELLAVIVVDPVTGWRIPPLGRESTIGDRGSLQIQASGSVLNLDRNRAVRSGICNLFSRHVG